MFSQAVNNTGLDAPVRVAVTYSQSVGGTSVISLKDAMRELDTVVVDADYRSIVPPSETLEDIYNSDEKMAVVFNEAKMKAKDFLEDIDCLILSGNSAMVDPRLYGENLKNEKIDLARAIAEMALIHVAMQRGMPILGICGGHQILNVYLGGKIKALNSKTLEKQSFLDYGIVNFDVNSELFSMINGKNEKSEKMLASRNFFGAHNQVVEEVGGSNLINEENDYLKVVATAEDEVYSIEAVESQFGAPVLGLQFHPEVGVKGLPNTLGGMLYQSPEEEISQNRKILEAFKKSAETFKRKQLLKLQIEQPKEIRNKEATHTKSAQPIKTKTQNKNSRLPKQHKFKSIGRLIRKFVSFNKIRQLVRALREKENSSPTVIVTQQNITKIIPQEIFREASTDKVLQSSESSKHKAKKISRRTKEKPINHFEVWKKKKLEKKHRHTQDCLESVIRSELRKADFSFYQKVFEHTENVLFYDEKDQSMIEKKIKSGGIKLLINIAQAAPDSQSAAGFDAKKLKSILSRNKRLKLALEEYCVNNNRFRNSEKIMLFSTLPSEKSEPNEAASRDNNRYMARFY